MGLFMLAPKTANCMRSHCYESISPPVSVWVSILHFPPKDGDSDENERPEVTNVMPT